MRLKNIPNLKHGLSGHRLYGILKNIKTRCNNSNSPNYKYYGGRGITLCKDWNDIENFYRWAIENGYKEGLTIDRIDNDENYEPDNCRWVTMKVQSHNRCNNVSYEYEGIKYSIEELSCKFNIKLSTLQGRINRGWDIDKAVNFEVNIKGELIEFNGMSKTLIEWSKFTGIKYNTLQKRLSYNNWSVERALTEGVDFN